MNAASSEPRGGLEQSESEALEDQRKFLLTSLRDLEVERTAGDIDEADYLALRDDYTARAAAVLRALEGEQSRGMRRRVARPNRLRAAGWVAGVVVFAVLAGVLVAQSSGRRGGGGLTGDIRLTTREQLVSCQQLLGEFALSDAATCFDEVIANDPRNAEALTYRGWTVAVAVLAPMASGDDAPLDGPSGDAALEEALEWLDRALAVDPSYPDALAFRIVMLHRSGRVAELPDAFDAFDAIDAPDDMVALVASLRDGGSVGQTPALACRTRLETDIIAALRCFDEVLAEDPDDVEALAYRGWALALTALSAREQGSESLTAELFGDALGHIEWALEIDDDNQDALTFAAIVLDGLGRNDEADERLRALFALDPPEPLVERLESYIPDARERGAG